MHKKGIIASARRVLIGVGVVIGPLALAYGLWRPGVDVIYGRNDLLKMERHHVHLSADSATTLQVGARRGRPVLLTVRGAEMHRAGHVFYLSANGVWLVDGVPTQVIDFPEGT